MPNPSNLHTHPGTVRADRRHVDVDDAALTAIDAAGGEALIADSSGDVTRGALVHDGDHYCVRAYASINGRAGAQVQVWPAGSGSPLSCVSRERGESGEVQP